MHAAQRSRQFGTVREDQFSCVKQRPPRAAPAAVLRVSQNGVADIRHMHPRLMRASRYQLQFDKALRAEVRKTSVNGERLLPVFVSAYTV